MLKFSKHLLFMKLMLMRKIELMSIYHPSNVNKTKCFMFNISKKLWMQTQTFVMKDRSLLELPFKNCQKMQEKRLSQQRGRNWHLKLSSEASPKLGARESVWSQYADFETVLLACQEWRQCLADYYSEDLKDAKKKLIKFFFGGRPDRDLL